MKNYLRNSLNILWENEQPPKYVSACDVINKLQKLYEIRLPEDLYLIC